jgi:ribosomal protein S18 acetylase RimI-like enzyme
MVIRPFVLATDYAATLDLWQHAGPGVHVGRSDTPAELDKKLQRDPDLFLVAEADGAIVGSVIGGYDGRRGLIYHLAVAPALRGRGLGGQLMAEVETRLRARGCVKAYLLVTLDNLAALAFYEHLGWGEMPMHLMGKEL